MKLELETFDVKGVEFGRRTSLEDGILTVDAQAVRERVLEDKRVEDVEIALARPGDSIRIVHVMDVVEPRCKPADDGATPFPGLLGPSHTAGNGTTQRLKGVAVVETGEPASGEPTWWREAILDMSGPAAPLSPFSQTLNVVLNVRPRSDVSYGEYNLATRLAGLRVAEYLARAANSHEPSRTETLELRAARDLPQVVYIYQVYTPYLYGHIDSELLATLLHPNEVLDGAIVNSRNGPACTRPLTYLDQNNAIIMELYARHAVDWNFRGVVAFTGHDMALAAKERGAAHAARVAHLLGADGAILSYPSSGHPVVNIMLVCRECERWGIKTVLVMNEMAATPDDHGFVHTVREAVAIVNTGNFEEMVSLPRVDRVIGGSLLLEEQMPADGEVEVSTRQILSSTSQSGYGYLRAVRY
jgi:glycine reductase